MSRGEISLKSHRSGSFVNELLRSVFWFGVVPNLLFGILGHFAYMMRPVVNVDYLLVGIAAVFIPRLWSMVFFGVVFANDLLVNGAPIYHFQIADLFLWANDVFLLNWRYSLPVALVLLAFVSFVSFSTIRLSGFFRFPRRTASALFALCFLICSADILNGTSFILLPIHQSFVNFNIAYSGVRRSLISMKELLLQKDVSVQPLTPGQSAAGTLLAQAKGVQPGLPKTQIALVVVESMGVFKDAATEALLTGPLATSELKKRYDVSLGTVPFHGHTIDGEFRELCGQRLLAYGEGNFPTCLPHYLSQKGFETVGFHGFTSQFYNRNRWYPKLGFDRIYFAEDMSRLGKKEICGSGFSGICDTTVAEMLHQELLNRSSAKPKFVYWMTLNSHLPLDSESSRLSEFDCSSNVETRSSASVCLHTRMINLVLSTLAKIANDPKLPPTEFIVTGDHMPPFMDPGIRSLYSDSEVPAIVLKPRQN